MELNKWKRKEPLAQLLHQTSAYIDTHFSSRFTVGEAPEMRGRASPTQFREQNPQRTWGLIHLVIC